MFNDAENLDFSLAEGSPATGLGCRVFAPARERNGDRIISKNLVHKVIRETEEVSGEISEDTFWEADTIRVTGDLVIDEDVNLQIAAGVRIEFANYYKVEVLGSILAEGSADQRIIFTSANPESFTYNGSHRSAWNGIRYPYTTALQDSSIFRYCVFEYAKSTLDTSQAGAAISLNNFSNIRIENSIFRNNVADRGGAIACRTLSQPEIINNLFHDNYCLMTGSVFYNEYSYPILINNTIAANYSIFEDEWTPSCALTNFFSKPKLMNNIIWGNETEYFIGGEIFEPRTYYYGINDIDQILNDDNLFLDPEFAGDWVLDELSVCLDAGDANLMLPSTDLAGNDRYSGIGLDLGCYELQVNGTDDILELDYGISIYPNPFNPTATINYDLAQADQVILVVYNIKGQRIWASGILNQEAGNHQLIWNGRDMKGKQASSGLYLFRLTGEGFRAEIKGILLK
ncbi:MAG: FlgD immunoglobulin-like domain containing protein [Candidatus Stygibacter frigidus]|nr:FlgD immunoglobulin-like domain containing protein [Candidatus Stygibacter frigidus]